MMMRGIRAAEVLRADPDRDREQDAAGDERRRLAPAGEEALDHVPGGTERVGTEEDPGEADEVERRDPRDASGSARPRCRAPRPRRSFRQRSSASAGAVETAPDDERPRRAVPEAADQHRQHQVAVRRQRRPRGCRRAGCRGSRAASARASCASAARSPGARRRGVGRVEVLREREAEQERDADRDVGVAGEVGVDLDRVGVDRDQDLERRVLARGGEDLVDDRRRRGSSRSPPS